MDKEQLLVRRPQSHKLMSEMVNRYWEEVRNAHEDGKLLAYCTLFPFFEMLRAMDIRFVQDENYGAYLLARRLGKAAIDKFDAEYDTDLCSYMKTCNTMMFYPEMEAPEFTKIPKPDFIAAMPVCGQQFKEVEECIRRLNIPAFWFDIPRLFEETSEEIEAVLPYVRQQIYDFADFLSDVTHRRFDWEGFKKALANTRENSRMWRESVEMAKHIPSPLTWFDSILNIFCCNVMQGTTDPQPYFAQFNAEMRERIRQGIGAIANEKYRLLWDFNVMFSKLRFMSELFARNQANVVIGPWVTSPHRSRWWLLNPEEPVNSLAYDLLTIYPMRHRKWVVDFISRQAVEYGIDGIVIMSPRTCKEGSCGPLVQAEKLRERTGLPVLNFQGDTGDEKLWSDSEVQTRIEAFIEEVAVHKERRARNPNFTVL